MKKLIGIRGHRGAGKESVAYLLASSLEFIRKFKDKDIDKDEYNKAFDLMYFKSVNDLVSDKMSAFENANFQFVYLDAFGDTPKAMVLQLLGCKPEYLWNEWWKDHAVVNMKTFEIREVDELPSDLLTSESLKDGFNDGEMSLREFILYFGQTVMQKYFGQDVWVKAVAQYNKNNRDCSFLDDTVRIYTDVKAPTELTYLIDAGALIINVERRGRKKEGGLNLLKDDPRWDYNIRIHGDDLMSIKDSIKEIAEFVYNEENN